MNNTEQDLQALDKAITDKNNKLKMAQFLSKKASNDEIRSFYSHRAELFEGELAILNEGHAKLTKKYFKQLN